MAQKGRMEKKKADLSFNGQIVIYELDMLVEISEEHAQVVAGELAVHGVGAAGRHARYVGQAGVAHSIGHLDLGLLHLLDALLDCLLAQQPVHGHVLLLTDAVDAIRTLLLQCRIPATTKTTRRSD